MKMYALLLFLLISSVTYSFAQRAVAHPYSGDLAKKFGVAIYPVGNQLGFRYNPSDRLGIETRINFNVIQDSTVFIYPSLRGVYRIDLKQYANFFIGFGVTSNMLLIYNADNYLWAELPIGAEIFPSNTVPNFSIIVEASPYYHISNNSSDASGLTVNAGVAYYF